MLRKVPDWLLYVMILTVIFSYSRTGKKEHFETSPPPELGPVLPSASPKDPQVIIQMKRHASSGIGTAFTADENGTWVTARHVVEGCNKVGLLLTPKRFVRVQVKSISQDSDIALLESQWKRPALPQDLETLRIAGEYGYFIGFPQGRPGEAVGALLGRRRMVVRGRYQSNEKILAWSEVGRTRGLKGSLGGLSGGPAFDSDGEIIGLVTAESVRRGRIYTVAPTSLRMTVPQTDAAMKPDPIDVRTYGRRANKLRRSRQVAQVYCLVE